MNIAKSIKFSFVKCENGVNKSTSPYYIWVERGQKSEKSTKKRQNFFLLSSFAISAFQNNNGWFFHSNHTRLHEDNLLPFPTSLLACVYHARTLQGFCTFCFHNLHTRGLFHRNFKMKKQGDKRKNVGDFLEKVQRFSEILPRFWENVQRFWRKVREVFLGLRIYRNSSAESLKSLDSLKSLNFSWIVQTLCAKDGNQYIFTSSSLRGDLAPSKRSFWREFRVRFIIL